jgi:hypothetical protein
MVPVGFGAAPKLVVARKMPNGTVVYGKPGDTHGALMGMDAPLNYDTDLGFAVPGGPYMTRQEALRWVDANEPARAPVASGPASNYRSGVPFRYLEANEYHLPVEVRKQ